MSGAPERTAIQKLAERLDGMNVEAITPKQFCSLIDNLAEDEFQALAAMLDEYRQPPSPVALPRDLAIDSLHAAAELEEHVLRLLEELGDDNELAADRRLLAIGKTHIELGFMAVNRSILKPGRFVIDPPSAAPAAETGWVLERADSPADQPLYWAPTRGGHGEQWSPYHGNAVRFAREVDAERLARAIAIEVRVAEHQWG